jgi:hypothetical protein
MEIEALAASSAGFAAATSSGLWHSTDGMTWTASASIAGIRSLAATSDGAFWACGGLLGGQPHGLFRSADGTSWPQVPAAFAGQEVTDVDADGLTVLAAVGGVVHRSNDAGATWTALAGGVRSFCFGDGSGTTCPCGNAGSAGNGCASSVNAAGANLTASGSASLSADTLVLVGSGMPDSSALYFQGTSRVDGGMGVVFGDGLRCVSGSIVRLKAASNSAGASQFPKAGDPSVSVRGMIAAPGTRTYQAWYRNAAAFCTPSTFNLTNGIDVTWN